MADPTDQRIGEKQQDAILQSLDPTIWTERCKPIGLIWKTLPRYYTDETLLKEHQKYQSALDIVELRLSRKVMSSYNQFVTAMNDVQSLGEDLHKSMTICRSSKEAMGSARTLLAVNGMTIVALYKRRQKQYAAITLMVKLRKFLKTRQEMNDRTKVGDFGTAFRLCMQIRDLYKDIAGLKCMQQIAFALKKDVDDLRAKVDRALGTLSRTNFHADTYRSILEAMVLMHGGKTMKILDSHTTHFKLSVESATKRAIITTLLTEPEMFSPEELERLKIVTLCRRLADRHFPMCLNLMFEQFCNYLFTYHAITVWLGDILSGQQVDTDTSSERSPLDEKTMRSYAELREGLLKHKRVLWEQEMQQNVTLMLAAVKINETPVETFLGILHALWQFIAIAEEFGGTKAHTMRETFRELSRVFFTQFHRTRLEKLKEIVEKETWMPVGDVKKDFGIKNFKELYEVVLATMPTQRAYKRRKQSYFDGYTVQSNPFASDTDGVDIDEFEMTGKKLKQIARYKWEESAMNPDLLVDFVDETGSSSIPSGPRRPGSPMSPIQSGKRSGKSGSSATSSGSTFDSSNPVSIGAPMVADVSKTVVSYIGDYMRLMQLMPHMTHLVFDALVQIVEYFLYTIHSFFAVSRHTVLSNGDRNLYIALRRIQSELLLDTSTHEAILAAQQAAALAAQTHGITSGIASTTSSVLHGIKDTFSLSSRSSSDGSSSSSSDKKDDKNGAPPPPPGTLTPGGVFYKPDSQNVPTQLKVVRPKPTSSLSSGSLQQQITQVATAAGSLHFLRKILVELQPNFIELLGRDRLAKVISFAGTLAETTVPLRAAIFRYAPQNFISVEKQVGSIGTGQWDSLDEDVRVSSYVKPLVKEVETYVEKLKAMVKGRQLPAELLPEMVAESLSFAMELCVEGYSKARRVTIGGHNIMLYDLQEVKGGLEKVASIRGHDWSFLDEYVHAYHFPTDDLLTFFREHPWYTKSQLQGLVVSGPWNQREKTKLLDALNYHGAFTASASNSRASSSTNRSRSSSRR